jgi:hypothetical protein
MPSVEKKGKKKKKKKEMKQKSQNCLRLCVLFHEYRIWQHPQEPSLRARDAFLWLCTNTDVLEQLTFWFWNSCRGYGMDNRRPSTS